MLKEKQIDSILDALGEIGNSHGGAVVGSDGIVLAARMDPRYPAEKIAALTSQAVSVCNKVVEEAKFGVPDTMVIEGTQGKMCIINSPKKKFFIVLLGGPELNLGMARLALDEAMASFG